MGMLSPLRRERLLPFIEVGVEHFIVAFGDFPNTDSLNMFSEQVIPRLRQGG